MKNLIILLVLGVAGYYAYQYFGGPALFGSGTRATSFNMYSLPEECQGHGESLQASFARNDISATLNSYAKTLRSCLRKAGYSDAQISEAYDGIKDSVR